MIPVRAPQQRFYQDFEQNIISVMNDSLVWVLTSEAGYLHVGRFLKIRSSAVLTSYLSKIAPRNWIEVQMSSRVPSVLFDTGESTLGVPLIDAPKCFILSMVWFAAFAAVDKSPRNSEPFPEVLCVCVF